MSIEWMTHVWNNSKQKGSQLLMLLAIADYANETGKAWPGIETLSQRTRQTPRNTIRIIEKLAKSGEITISERASNYGTNEYTLNLSTAKKKARNPKMSHDNLGKKDEKPHDISGPQLSPDPLLTVSKSDPLFDSIAKVCQVDCKTAGGSIGTVKAALVKATPPYTAEDVLAFESSWWAWKDRVTPPTLWQLKERIGMVRQSRPSPKPQQIIDPNEKTLTPDEAARQYSQRM